MNTIYKAIPDETEINITYLDESLEFIGNDAETITVEDVQYGKTLLLEDFDSLKEINIKKPTQLSHSTVSKNTIRINEPSKKYE